MQIVPWKYNYRVLQEGLGREMRHLSQELIQTYIEGNVFLLCFIKILFKKPIHALYQVIKTLHHLLTIINNLVRLTRIILPISFSFLDEVTENFLVKEHSIDLRDLRSNTTAPQVSKKVQGLGRTHLKGVDRVDVRQKLVVYEARVLVIIIITYFIRERWIFENLITKNNWVHFVHQTLNELVYQVQTQLGALFILSELLENLGTGLG